MAISFPELPDMADALRRLIAQIPPGRVATCGELAEALGNRIAALWVGQFSLHHEHGAQCACHRIVRADGQLGGYIAGSLETKSQRLADEGVVVECERIDLGRFGFRSFESDRPLERLRHVQEAIQRHIIVRPRQRVPETIGGVDVAYPSPERGVAAYALVETATGRLVWSATVERRVRFPYISTYLSFREMPILLDLLDEVRAAGRLAEVLLVDGSGILHQRHAGIASHLGVVAAVPTVGVTKKLLCGQADLRGMACGESRPVIHDGCEIGVALRLTSGSRRPIFISPGHRVDVAFSEQVVRRLAIGRRLPGPIYWADLLGRRAG